MYKTAGGELLCGHRELTLVLCDNLEGWDGVELGGGSGGKGHICNLWLIHVVVWQKPTQYCKAIILQLKKNFFNGDNLEIVLCVHRKDLGQWFTLDIVYPVE